MIETEAGHRKRTGNAPAALPTAPTDPIKPTGTTVSGTTWKMYEHELEAYETAEHWNQEIINVLQVKFPTGLTDLEIEDGMLPLDLTRRVAFDHIEGKVISSIVATKAYLDLVKDITNRLYVPSGNGQIHYFQDMKRDRLSAAIIKVV